MKKRFQNYVRGWFPQETLHKNYSVNKSSDPKTKTELDKKLFKNGWVANAIIVMVFLGANFSFIQPYYNFNVSIEITLLSLGAFLSTLIAVNLLLYWRYKKQLL